MSHFVVVCFCEPNSNNDYQEAIDKLLAPYNENLEVDEYDKDCYCINSEAMRAGNEAAEKELGTTIEEIRKKFWANPLNQELDGKAKDAAWKDEIAPMREARERHTRAHDMFMKPDSSCENCHGTGKYKSTYNPKSKWDWYVIGGRWEGCLKPDYDPDNDPRNYSTCEHCNGAGIRDDWATIDANGNRVFKDKHAEYCNGCNGCHGTGKSRNWENAPVEGGNFRKVSELAPDFLPFAFVTPDGEWHEKGEMFWFAITTNEQDENTWRKEWFKAVNGNPNHVAVIVDCHI